MHEGTIQHLIYDAARRLADAYITERAAAFETYAIARVAKQSSEIGRLAWLGLQEDELAQAIAGAAVEALREREHRGEIAAFTADLSVATKQVLAKAEHPLLRMLAEHEFACAVTEEAEAALAELPMLRGWDGARMRVVRYRV